MPVYLLTNIRLKYGQPKEAVVVATSEQDAIASLCAYKMAVVEKIADVAINEKPRTVLSDDWEE